MIEDKKGPAKFALHQNYPNPFNPSTIISFEINSIQKVSLKVYDNQSRFVRSLLNKTIHVGKHEISLDGRNDQGDSVSAGIYYYRLEGAGFNQTNKMILIR
jgi:flagellar hook assembly protein FlgD